MLYDQAMLAMAYLEAYQAGGGPLYASTARDIFEYVARDMTAPEGAFYSAEDADSEGREGKFYLWTMDEINDILGQDDAEYARKIFNLATEGNFTDQAAGRKIGENIHISKPCPLMQIGSKPSGKSFSPRVIAGRVPAGRQGPH